jgi:signal transduction histidine kinase
MRLRIWVLCIIAVFSTQIVLNANNTIDSLEALIEKKTGKEKVDAMYGVAREYLMKSSNIEYAIELAEQALEASEKLNYDLGKIRGYSFFGYYYTMINKIDKAFEYQNKALDLSKKINLVDGIIDAKINLNSLYYKTLEIDKSTKELNEALEILNNKEKNDNDYKKMASIYNSLALNNDLTGNYTESMKWHNKSLELGYKHRDTVTIITSFMNIGLFNLRFRDYNEAIRYLKKALAYIAIINDSLRLRGTYYNLGNAYKGLEEYDSALVYNRKAIDIFERFNDSVTVGRLLNNRASIFLDLNKYDEALKKASEAEGYLLPFNDIYGLSLIKKNRARIHFLKNEYQNAIKLYKDIIGYFEYNNVFDQLDDIYYSLALSYKAINDYKNSTFYFGKLMVVKDSIANNQLVNEIISLEIQNEREKQKTEINLLKKENEIKEAEQNNQILAMSSVIVLLLLLSVFAYYRYRLKKKHSDELQTLINTKNKFFSIISHDLRGPLSSYNQLSKIIIDTYDDLSKDEIKKHLINLEQSSGHIYNLLENLLTWSRMETKDLIAEPDHLEISKIISEEIERFKTEAERKKVSISYSDGVPANAFSDEYMTRSVVRNLLSNALKFTPENGMIDVKLKESADNIEVSVKDSGIGIKETDKPYIFNIGHKVSRPGTNNEKGAGLGLTLCKDFIEMNKGSIEFKSDEGKGTEFTFTLPKAK